MPKDLREISARSRINGHSVVGRIAFPQIPEIPIPPEYSDDKSLKTGENRNYEPNIQVAMPIKLKCE